MFESPPTFEELMIWADTGVPPEDQVKPSGAPLCPNCHVVLSLENETLSETIETFPKETSPRERMSRTWFQGAVAAAVVAALEVVVSLSWTGEFDVKFLAFALVQATVTGFVAYYHKTKTEKEGK